MKDDWPTREYDIYMASCILEDYIEDSESGNLGLFELVVNQEEKRMDFRLSAWVLALAEHFREKYGPHQGDNVTRRIISHCLIEGETIH